MGDVLMIKNDSGIKSATGLTGSGSRDWIIQRISAVVLAVYSVTGINKNKIMPEIRCKIEAIAIGERLTLITWLKGRSIGRLLFTAGILFAVILLYLLSRPDMNSVR